MIDLIRAEWLKIAKNVKLTAALVWVFPIGAATVLLVGIVINLAVGGFAGYMAPGNWTTDLLGIWTAINAFPLNVFGRLLPMSFMAVVFAGEFQWETWRLIVPKSSRSRLVVAKLVALTLTILLSFILTSLVIVTLQAAGHRLIGQSYPPAVTMDAVSDAFLTFMQEVLIAFLTLFLLGSFAAVAAFITKSVLGALLLTFGFSVAELLSLGLLALLSVWLKRPNIVNAYRWMPSYNLENMRSWFVHGHGLVDLPFNLSIEASLSQSIVLVGIWILVIAIWGISMFQRMDIN